MLFQPLGAKLLDNCDALVGRHLPPEFSVGIRLFFKRSKAPEPSIHVGAV
jgi:hypothetical protein